MVWRNTQELEPCQPDISIRVYGINMNSLHVGVLYHPHGIACVLEVNDSIYLLRHSTPRLKLQGIRYPNEAVAAW